MSKQTAIEQLSAAIAELTAINSEIEARWEKQICVNDHLLKQRNKSVQALHVAIAALQQSGDTDTLEEIRRVMEGES